MSTQELTLRDGKFYRGKEEVPAEIGNREQITLLRKKERELEEIDVNGGPVDFVLGYVRADIYYGAECLCGSKITGCFDGVQFSHYEDLEVEVENYLDEKKIQCSKCRRSYRIEDMKAKRI